MSQSGFSGHGLGLRKPHYAAFLAGEAMVDYWCKWTEKYPIRSIEDGLAENDWTSWKLITELELEWKKRKGCV